MIRCVVLDFDGTLVHSNEIKREGFLAVASKIPGGGDWMKKILSDSPGDRYAIFHRFAEEVGASAPDLVADYSRWCEERILDCPERQGASRSIVKLRAAGIRVYINSATPTEFLRSIIIRRFGVDFFDGVYGGFGEKANNIRMILALEEIQPIQTVMVGDGIDDWGASNVTGCRFIGVPNGTLTLNAYDGPLLADFNDIWPHLDLLGNDSDHE